MLSTKVDQVHLNITREPGEAYQASPGTKRERRYRIQPPPKIVLEVDGDDARCQWLENPRTFLMARLPANPNILFGKTVESIQRQGDQAVFIFRDLSCQEAGEHQLEFTLFSRDSDNEPAYMVKRIDSQPFVVVANRSARRRSDRSKTSPRLRHRLSSREALSDRVRLEPKKKSSVGVGLAIKSDFDAIKSEQDGQSDTNSIHQPMFISPSTPSPTIGTSNEAMYTYLSSSSPAYTNVYSSPLGISCGMDATRGGMSAFTPYGSNFSMPLTPRDSTLPAFPWCFGDLANEGDSAATFENFPDPNDSPIWSQHVPFSAPAEMPPFTMSLIQPQWRMGTHL